MTPTQAANVLQATAWWFKARNIKQPNDANEALRQYLAGAQQGVYGDKGPKLDDVN